MVGMDGWKMEFEWGWMEKKLVYSEEFFHKGMINRALLLFINYLFQTTFGLKVIWS